VITKPVDPGLLTVLREQIVPRLKDDVAKPIDAYRPRELSPTAPLHAGL
jgi:hypothetical protein